MRLLSRIRRLLECARDTRDPFALDYATCCRRSQIDDGASAATPVLSWCGVFRGGPAPVFPVPAIPAAAIVGAVDLAMPSSPVLWVAPWNGRCLERAHRLQARIPAPSAGRRIRGNDDARLLRLCLAAHPENR